MNPDIQNYNEKQESSHKGVCDFLAEEIELRLSGAESKIWHGHPV